ncbi:MAG: Eco57I restriction-modification methylase domain-containing protein, partial [Anaerolineales bacterium]
SLVQRVGDKTFPVEEHAALPLAVKRKITALKKRKRNFFYNESDTYAAIAQEELEVFHAILDAEIDARRAEIRKLLAPKPQQDALLDLGPEQTEMDLAATTAERREALEAEIAELLAQKRALQDERPFIWSIEFAEIFFDAGGFDVIIGNPPYVRVEGIRDPYGHLSSKAYKAALREMVLLDFPGYFAKSQADVSSFKRGRQPSGRSDLYTYFYVRSLRLLNPQGVHVFICSNSWLDVKYGAWLQEFFLRRVPLHFVIDNHARRSFASADVNTIITVMDAPGEAMTHQPYKFVAFKQPFEDVVLSDNLLQIDRATTTTRDEVARVYPITPQALLAEGREATGGAGLKSAGKYVGDKWGGKYLRAPDIFFTILEKGKSKLVRLGDVAEVRFGIKTGANDFFYLEPLGPGSQPGLLRVCNGAGWEGEIEEEFLQPAIKSPRESRMIMLDPTQLRYRLFMCHKSREELKDTKALTYIVWGETQNYHKRPSCRGRRFWWSLPGDESSSLLHFNYLINEVGRTFVGDCLASDNFHEISLSKEHATFLNSSIFFLFQLLIGRANFGGGLLKIQTYELQKVPILLDLPFAIQPTTSINTIYTECGIDPDSDIPIAEQEPHPLPDRKALDDLVFDALDLTANERREVYCAVCQLVWDRLHKAKSV